ncbi:NUDIX hydrolase [Smaragdicoccus niigatensis]|uniref:NUDIX hydrolase n=1 Tax=Smaragdicoccus niigatensis TaxID=359359 RepID=UPI00035E7B05|nr:NUDIX domain-containing protein [Smaragdicoccus niigatensis]
MPTPDFILDLRQKVGHAPLWLPAVSAVVVDDQNRVLLTLRQDFGEWAVISGILEPGEEPAAGILREIREETGIDVELVRVGCIDVTPQITYTNGDEIQFLDICFLARYISGDPYAADDENTDVRWFAVDALPPNIRETTLLRVEKTLAGGPEAWFRS